MNKTNVSLAHAPVDALKATARRHCELDPCSGCSMQRGSRRPLRIIRRHERRCQSAWSTLTPRVLTRSHSEAHGTWSRSSTAPLASRVCTVLGIRTSPPFVADRGLLPSLRTDNSSEYTDRIFVEFCDGLGIRR